MRERWRKTVEMFWEHPVLWLPYIVAESCSAVVTFVGTWIRHQIVNSFLVTHSVLGGESTHLDPGRVHNALIFSAPVEVAQHLLDTILAAVALVWTARCVESILAGESTALASALRRLKADQGRILWFALKFAACVLAGVLLLYAIGTPLTIILNQKFGASITVSSWLFGGTIVTAAAWIATPWAITLLRDADSPPIKRDEIRVARTLAVLVAASTVVLGFAYNSIRHRIQVGSPIEGKMVGAIAGLIVNSPQILLFIAFALLSSRQASPAEIIDAAEPDTPPAELI